MDQKIVTLEDILSAREERASKQRMLIGRYNMPLLSFTLNIPGPVKDSAFYRRIHKAGVSEILMRTKDRGISLHYEEIDYKATGPEAYICFDTDCYTLKRIAVDIETGHPLGRIFDFDVLDKDHNLISRSELGLPKRRCLLCNEDASICGRSRAHNIDELLERIEVMSRQYFETQCNKE